MKPIIRLQVPARTELAGNHTDHQGGRVLCAAIRCYLKAEAGKSAEVRVLSAGYPEIRFDPNCLSVEYSEPGTPGALIRGVMEELQKAGVPVGGFSARLESEIPVGAGFSSSAALAVLTGEIQNALYADGGISPMQLAKAAQAAENRHFGKPCGLMDDAICALRGVRCLDFRNAEMPQESRIASDLFYPEYRLLALDTGAGHANLTDDYALVRAEMSVISRHFGCTRLCEVRESAFRAEMAELRRRYGDRAVLRALHYFEEDARVPMMAEALAAGDVTRYLELMDESGRSSAENLQNGFSPADPAAQGIPLALALCRRVLGRSGAARVHGGGFAGSIQILAPEDRVAALTETLTQVFGEGCLQELRVAD